MNAPGSAATVDRYDAVARWLHALIGLALLAQLVFGVMLNDIAPRGTPARAGVINLHKSLGLVLGGLIVLRLAWRLGHRPPAWPERFDDAQRRAARWGHRLLYGVMLALPAAGYVASNFSKHGVKFFGTPLPPWGPDIPWLYQAFGTAHRVLAWMLMLLVVGHVAMAIRHARGPAPGLLRRIAPGS